MADDIPKPDLEGALAKAEAELQGDARGGIAEGGFDNKRELGHTRGNFIQGGSGSKISVLLSQGSVTEVFARQVVPKMAEVFGCASEGGLTEEHINAWLEERWQLQDATNEQKQAVEHQLSILRSVFGNGAVMHVNAAGTETPSRTHYRVPGKTGMIRMGHVDGSGYELHQTIDFPHIRVHF